MKTFGSMVLARLFWIIVVLTSVLSCLGLAGHFYHQAHPYDGTAGVVHTPSHAQPVQVPAVADPVGQGETPYLMYIGRRMPAGWTTFGHNRAVLIANAGTACLRMSQGHTPAETVGWMMDQVHARDWDVPIYVAQVYGAQKYICGGSR